MILSSKEFRRIVYAVLSLEHVKTFDSMMKSITCTRPFFFSVASQILGSHGDDKQVVAREIHMRDVRTRIQDVACCDVCNPPRQRVSRRLSGPFRA